MREIVIPWLLVRAGLPYKKPDCSVWQARSGIRVMGDDRYGVPFGRSRIPILYVGNAAIHSGSRVVQGKVDDALDLFELGERNRQNLEEHIRGLLASSFEEVVEDADSGERAYRCVEFIEMSRYRYHTQEFAVLLHEQFVASLHNSPRCPLNEVKHFVSKRQFAAFDLYVFYRWKEHRGETAPVDFRGPDSPFAFLAGSRRFGNQCQKLNDLHDQVIKAWPDCPYKPHKVDRNTMLLVHRQQPVGRGDSIEPANTAPVKSTRIRRTLRELGKLQDDVSRTVADISARLGLPKDSSTDGE